MEVRALTTFALSLPRLWLVALWDCCRTPQRIERVFLDQGRCCGEVPISGRLRKYCTRCHREYAYGSNEQVESWAWKRKDGDWVKTDLYHGGM